MEHVVYYVPMVRIMNNLLFLLALCIVNASSILHEIPPLIEVMIKLRKLSKK